MNLDQRQRPENAAPDYIYSKKITGVLDNIVPEVPGDKSERNPYESLITVQKQLIEVEKELQNARIQEQDQKKTFHQKWQLILHKEALFTREFMNFEKFVIENRSKIERGKKRIAELKEVRQFKEGDLKVLQEKYDDLVAIKEELLKQIAAHHKYQAFLLAFIKAYPNFGVIQIILNKYFSLEDMKLSLGEFLGNQYTFIQDAKDRLMQLIEENSLEIMGLKTYTANLQRRYETARSKSLESEQSLIKIKTDTKEKLNEMVWVKSVIWDIYSHMVKSKKHTIELEKSDVEHQLLYIKRMLYELHKINKLIVQKKIKKQPKRM